jgi:hypothetical protein
VPNTEKTPNKSEFVKSILEGNPRANPTTIRDEWSRAGYSGSISTTLVSKFRRELGLAGNIRGRRRGRPKGSKNKPKGMESAVVVSSAPAPRAPRTNVLAEVETDIDRAIFKLMSAHGFDDIENQLRSVRRMLVIRGERG